MEKGITGTYNDRLTDIGSQPPWTSGWQANRIVQSCDQLLAALLKGQTGLQGLMYLAIGQGEVAWDINNPAPPETSIHLHSELIRYPLSADQITFIDNAQQPSTVPTHQLQITVEIPGTDLVTNGYQSLREFGLFGGDASDAADSGYLINYVIHPRIDIIPSATLNRQMRLKFFASQSIQTTSSAPHWLETSTVKNIDGIGTTYLTTLEDSGITTIDKLVTTEPEISGVSIPRIKFLEMRAKAQLAINTARHLNPVPGIMEKKAHEVIETPLLTLVAQTGLTEEVIKDLLVQLGNLQVALDSNYFKNLTIAELTQVSL